MVIGNKRTYNKPLEIGGKQTITYMDLLKITAKKNEKKEGLFFHYHLLLLDYQNYGLVSLQELVSF